MTAPDTAVRPRAGLARQVTLVTCAAVALATVATALLSLGLVQGAYDGQARTTLGQQAELVAQLADNPANGRRPVSRLLSSTGVTVLRVTLEGRVIGPVSGLDSDDLTAAAAGEEVSAVRQLSKGRTFVEIRPVGTANGGIVLTQRARDASAGTRAVFRRFLVALLVGLVAAVLLATLLARRLARPLVRAAGAARLLATGERNVRLPVAGPAELAELASDLNALAAALTTSEARQREFLLSVSHELRTPLTAVLGFAEALADGVATGPEAVHAGRVVQAEAVRLQRLVSDLLDLARLGADDFRLDLADVDLTEMVAAAGAVWQQRSAAAGVRCAVELPPGPLVVRTDASRLRQVVDGLAENALRVTPSGRPLVLSLGGTAGEVVVQVRDGGPGLTDDDLAVAFHRSALRDRYAGTRRTGTGLGLALVAGLVARLGGTVTAGHAPEGGASFTVRLPGVVGGVSTTGSSTAGGLTHTLHKPHRG